MRKNVFHQKSLSVLKNRHIIKNKKMSKRVDEKKIGRTPFLHKVNNKNLCVILSLIYFTRDLERI